MLSQKDLKREIFHKKDALSDKNLFMAVEYAEFLSQMAGGVTECKYPVSSVMFDQGDDIAYTNGKTVHINYSSALAEGLDRIQRHMLYCGLNLHECGHILFTDFSLHQKVMEEMSKGRVFPLPDQNEYLKELIKFIEVQGNYTYIYELFNCLDNSIEDGFVDRAVMAEAPGYAPCLRYVAQIDKSIDAPTYMKMIAEGLDGPTIFVNLTLSYARHGIIAFPDNLHDELSDLFRQVIPYIDKAVEEPYPLQRKKAVWTVFSYLFHFFKRDNVQQCNAGDPQSATGQAPQSVEQQPEECQGPGRGAMSSATPQSSRSDQPGAGGGNPGEENGQGNTHSPGECSSQSGEQSTEDTANQSQGNNQDSMQSAQGAQSVTDGGNPGEENGQGNTHSPGECSSQSGEQSTEDTANQSQGNGQDSMQSAQGTQPGADGGNPGEGNCQNVLRPLIEHPAQDDDALKNRLKNAGNNAENTEKVQHVNPGTPSDTLIHELSKKMRKRDETTSSASVLDACPEILTGELDRIADKVVYSQIACDQEKDINKQMQFDIKEFLDGIDCHKNVKCIARRKDVASSAREKYETMHSDLDVIVKRLVSEFQREIKDRQLGDTLTGLYSGRRFNSRDAYRYDKRVMSRKIAPENIPDMQVAILIDESGSMEGERLETAIKCAYITYQFCRTLLIPCSIIGHTTYGSKVVLENICDKDSLDNKDCQRIFSMEPQGCNRDGYAVWFCIKKLEQAAADQKLLMIISDGKPNHDGYGMETGRADCQAAVKYGIKNNITTIAAAIGDPAGVRSVYKDGVSEKGSGSAKFLDLTDLQKLPKAFVKIIKRQMQ